MDIAYADKLGDARALDPLSAAEIAAAAAFTRAAHDLGAGMRFETIVLHEPDVPGHPGRRAFVATYDIATGDVFEAIVSLTDGAVESWTPRPGARPRYPRPASERRAPQEPRA